MVFGGYGGRSVLACLIVCVASAAEDVSLEFAVKAAYLLKFTKFIDWPPLDKPIVQYLYFGRQSVRYRAWSGHRRRERERKKGGHPEVRSRSVPRRLPDSVLRDPADAARTLVDVGSGVLTVGEGQAFVRNGGMIGFIIDSHRVTFDINKRAAEAAGIRLSSGLLSVAKSVIK